MPKNKEQTNEKTFQQEKERTRKAAAEQSKSRCNICGFYTDGSQPACPRDHGGKSGGGGDSGGGAGDEKAAGASKNETAGQSASTSNAESHTELADIRFNPEVILDLLTRKFIEIENIIDNAKGIGTLAISFNLSLLAEPEVKELIKFLNAVLKELDTFKKEKGITEECKAIEQDKTGKVTVNISLPLALHKLFIERVIDQNLIPAAYLQPQVKAEKGVSFFNPPKLTMKTQQAVKDEDKKSEQASAQQKKKDQQATVETKPESNSPFRVKKPWERPKLKPNGFK